MRDKTATDTTLLQDLRTLAPDAEARATLGRLVDALDEGVAEARFALQVAAGCFEDQPAIEIRGPLSSLEPLAGLAELRTIDLDANRIGGVEPCRGLQQLEELWLCDNALSSTDDLAPLAQLPRLQTLRLERCPLAAAADYRAAVRRAVPTPSLVQLDADPLKPIAG